MKILIVSTIMPFIMGGGELIVDWLDKALQKYGHTTEVIKIPFHLYAPEMVEQMLALRLLDVKEYADLLIAIRTPSYIIDHPNKVVWFIHHHRQAYDLWGTYQDVPNTPEGLRIRETIIQADNRYLRQAKKIYTNSRVVSERLKKFNNIDSEVLYPPLMDAEQYCCEKAGDYFFYPSRITMLKRQYLAIESMKYTRSNAKLIVAGHPDTPEQFQYIKTIIEREHLQDKVKLIGNWISQEEKIELFARSLGCIFIPLDEDSYGYVTLEAYHSRKPVITCSDSGGTLELVENGVNGRVVQSDPKIIAMAMDDLFNYRSVAARMGQTGYEKLTSMNITWDHVVEKLTG